MQKTIGSNPEVQFLYDRLNPVQELNSRNAVVANLLTGLNTDEYFTRTASSTTSTFLSDVLDSTIGLVTAANGPIATTYTYQPFGATTVGGAVNGNSYEFTGRENDGTGQDYYRARYYSPTLHRFIAQDPIGFGGGDTNLYAYTSNDPLNYIDPRGLGATNYHNTAGGRNPLIPTNGEYGGPDWSGGLGPGQLGPPAPPEDSGDECYAAHDACYDACNSKLPCHDAGKCHQCNQDLAKCLRNLPANPLDWPRPPIPGTETASDWYRQFALNWFETK